MSKTDHTTDPNSDDSAKGAFSNPLESGVPHVRDRRQSGDPAHLHRSPVVCAGSLVSNALDPVGRRASHAASGRDRHLGIFTSSNNDDGSGSIIAEFDTIT